MRAWNNAEIDVMPIDVAQTFATQYLSGALYTTALDSIALFRRGDVRASMKLVEQIPASEFGSSQEYLLWAQFRALFCKSSRVGGEKLRRHVAMDSFLASELACKRANKRLRWFGGRPDRENPTYRVILSRARELIRQTLGEFTPSVLRQVLDFSRPGGGTCIGTSHRDKVTAPFKLGPQTRLCTTSSALPYARLLVEEATVWWGQHTEWRWNACLSPYKREGTWTIPARRVAVQYEVVPGNRIAFVPKDARKMRTIAVEPHLNLCLQLGAMEVITRRLKAVGVDLSSQELNQWFARKGAAEWQAADPYVTLDLSAASDSLSVALVERLLPSDWLGFLDDIRSPSYTLGGGDPVEYQKWSSMGNGTTFPLESLIFWAIGEACITLCSRPSRVVVYGDDIVIRRSAALLFVEVLQYAGFRVNREKSFVFGPFRESCGADWWGDAYVTPVYLRYMTKLHLTDLYRLINTCPFQGDDFVSYLYSLHAGHAVLRGFRERDPSSHVWCSLSELREKNAVRWDPRVQAWRYWSSSFRPHRARVGNFAAYAAALLGDKQLTDERWSKATLRSRGRWTLVSRVGG